MKFLHFFFIIAICVPIFIVCIYICSVLLCILISGPFLYIWLNWLSTVGDELYDDYKFGCIGIIVSCIIEVIAEPPVFVAQVFCFVKLKVMLDTLHIFVRSTIFVWLVLRDPSHAIFAFGVAQIGSSITFLISYYAFFCYYIARQTAKVTKNDEVKDKLLNEEKNLEAVDSIPFNSIMEFMPGNLTNPVIASIYLRLHGTQTRYIYFSTQVEI